MSKVAADIGLWRVPGRFKGRILHAQKSVVKTVLAGHQCHSCGSAQGHGIKGFKAHTVSRHAIQIGRLVLGMTVTAQLGSTQIVRENQNHIRTGWCGWFGRCSH